MPYDAKPTLDDVILSASGEGDGMRVALHMRVDSRETGALVAEWAGADCARMFADGILVRGIQGPLDASDEMLAESAIRHASEQQLGALAGFERSILDAMAIAEDLAPAAYDALVDDLPCEDYDPIQGGAADVIHQAPFPAMSSNRLHDVHLHLQGVLEEIYEMEPAPSP